MNESLDSDLKPEELLVTRRNVLGLVVVPVAVVILGMTAARLVDKNDQTRQIAVFAAVIALCNFVVSMIKSAYDVWDKERERQKKEDDKKECIRATLKFGSHIVSEPDLIVELYNDGSTTVAIKSVKLVVNTESGQQAAEMLAFGELRTRYDMNGTPSQDREFVTCVKLEPKDHTRFSTLGNTGVFKHDELFKLPTENLTVVVESFNGEVARLEGSKIQEILKQHLDRVTKKRTR